MRGQPRLVAVMVAALLAGAGAASAQVGLDAAVVGGKQLSPPPPGPHIRLDIQAPKTAHHQMLCQVRSYRQAPGQYVNRYGVDTTGPYQDTILSPNAHCTAELVSGPGPVRITLSKPGSVQTMTITKPGPAGKSTLQMW